MYIFTTIFYYICILKYKSRNPIIPVREKKATNKKTKILQKKKTKITSNLTDIGAKSNSILKIITQFICLWVEYVFSVINYRFCYMMVIKV